MLDWKIALLLGCATLASTNSVAGPAGSGAESTAEKQYDLKIASQPLLAAVEALSAETGLEVLYFSDIAEGVVSAALEGTYTARAALTMILRDTTLEVVSVGKAGAAGIRAKSGQVDSRLAQRDGAAAAGSAQDQPDPQSARSTANTVTQPKRVLEETVVTGSRIPKSNLVTAIPTQILGIAEISAAGSVDLGEILTQLPGVSLGLSPESTLASTQNAGLSSVSLRNLGTNRTLTLIDGRRTVSSSGTSQQVDLGSVPAGFVERIEVSTGGASAVYGSDAVAGVVNIILKEKFEGVELAMRYGDSDDGGERETTVDLTLGKNFADQRGNLMASFSFDKETAVSAADRDFAVKPLAFDAGEFVTDLSSNIPGGNFEGGDAWNSDGVWFNDQSLAPDDGRDPADGFDVDRDGFNFRPLQQVSPERERFAAALKADYEFGPGLKAFTSMQYSRIDTEAIRPPNFADDGDTFGAFDDENEIGDIPQDNPFIPSQVDATRTDSVSWRRRFNEIGHDARESKRDTVRFWTGLEGQVFSAWSWSVYAGYGRFKQDQLRRNQLNYQNIQFAINVEQDAANPGGFRCIDATTRAAGCVPLNMFGEGSITPAMAAYIRANDQLDTKLEQTTFGASLLGDLFELPAGPVQAAFGVDHRREEQRTRGDPVTQAGLTNSGEIPDIRGDYDVSEIYAEFSVPVLASLNAEAAIRIADYDTIGTSDSWKLGVSWAPVEDVRLRAQLSSAERAPDIIELFSTLRGDFDSPNDPCDGVTAASTGVVADNCLADPGIRDAVNAEGQFVTLEDSVFAPNSGNLQLQEETARTVTFGIVLTPTFLPGLTLIADYYDIKIKDAIASVSTQEALDLCYDAPTSLDNRFCEVIDRGSAGQITRVINQDENLNEIRSSGVDVTLGYDFALPLIVGQFNFQTIYTHIRKLEDRFDGPGGEEVVSERRGEIGNSVHSYQAMLEWSYASWRLRYRANYIGSADDDIEVSSSDDDYFKVEPITTHDLYGSYQFGKADRYQLFAGVNNIDNETGPFIPNGLDAGSNRNFDPAYDPVGRFFYGGFKLSL